MKSLLSALNHWPIILIIIVAAVLRFWRLEELTTFGGDQGYDFLIVKRMLLDGEFTLLGPKIGPYNQIGNLYLGPAYYYLIAPALFLFHFDPIGPAVLTVIMALGTILLIYLIGNQFIRKSVAILSSSLYTTNTFLIDQSRAPSNPHLIPFFAALTIYSTLMIIVNKSKSIVWPLICGFSLGVVFQLHYLGVSLFLSVLAILFLTKNLKKFIPALASFLITISPQILFEIRHEFFITNELIRQLKSGEAISFSRFIDQFVNSIQNLTTIFTRINKFTIAFDLLFIFIIILIVFRFQKIRIPIFFLTASVIFNLILASLYFGAIQPHYFSTIYPSLIILLAVSIVSLFLLIKNFLLKTILIILIAQIFVANLTTLNLARYEGYTMPHGWNLKGTKIASAIIAKDVDNSKKFNIASTLDGDTRARPYRYLVEVAGKFPQGVEHYPQSDVIYLISRDDQEAIKSYTVWEISSFAPFNIEDKWEIQNGIKLYKLTKNQK